MKNETPKVQPLFGAKEFRKYFFDKYPDLREHEPVINVIALKLWAIEYGRGFAFIGRHPAWEVAAKLLENGYKGGRVEAVMEAFDKAARLELARQQQPPPIVGVGQGDEAYASTQDVPKEDEWHFPTAAEELEDFQK